MNEYVQSLIDARVRILLDSKASLDRNLTLFKQDVVDTESKLDRVTNELKMLGYDVPVDTQPEEVVEEDPTPSDFEEPINI